MNNWELTFFLLYIIIQIIIPMRRFIYIFLIKKGKSNILGDHYFYFSWTMKVKTVRNKQTTFIIFNRKNLKIIDKIKITHPSIYKKESPFYLADKQAKYLTTGTCGLVQYSHYLKKVFEEMGHKNVGVRVEQFMNINNRGRIQTVDPSVDLSEQKVQAFKPYKWLLNDNP